MHVRFIPGAREKGTGKESFNRTENRYWCPSLRKMEGDKSRLQSLNGEGVLGEISLGNLANWPRILGIRGAYCLSLAGISRSQLQGGYDCLTKTQGTADRKRYV
jgi:hypothetical protein